MKKLLLFAAAAMMSTSAFAQWAVVGAYSTPNWNFEASVKFTGEGNDLSCTIDYLTNDFKIVDITNDNWDVQYGTSTPLEINTPYTLDGKNGGADPSNMSFSGLIQGVKNATVKWNPSTFVMEIVASESDLVIEYPTLYLTGSFNNWATPQDAIASTREGSLYTFNVDLGDSGYVEFKVAGNNWSNEIAGGVEVGYEAVEVTKGGGNLITTLTGMKILKFDYDLMSMWFEEESGVESLVDMNAPAVYYNLQGVKVENPAKGIYVVRQGDKTSKVVIR